MRKDRLIIGLICVAIAVWLFVAGDKSGPVAPAITILILGLSVIAFSRR